MLCSFEQVLNSVVIYLIHSVFLLDFFKLVNLFLMETDLVTFTNANKYCESLDTQANGYFFEKSSEKGHV